MVMQPAAVPWVGGANPYLLTWRTRHKTTAGRPGFKPPTCKSIVGYITIRRLFLLKHFVLPTA